MKFVIKFETECSVKRTADMSYAEAMDLMIKEINDSEYIVGFGESIFFDEKSGKSYGLKDFKRKVGIFTETVVMVPYIKQN